MPLGAGGARAQDGQAELQEQEVVEGQPAMRGRRLGLRLREVSAAQGGAEGGQAPARPDPLGQHLVDLAGVGAPPASA